MKPIHVDDFDGALDLASLIGDLLPQEGSEEQLGNLFENTDCLWQAKELFYGFSVVL